MKEQIPNQLFDHSGLKYLLCVLTIGMLLLTATSALAKRGGGTGGTSEPVTPIGPTPSALSNAACMQDVAGFNLSCNANDVQIATARNIDILDDGCAFQGDTVTFQANFELVLTAKERHDIGIYFASDGDPNFDGATTGTCSISTIPTNPTPPWIDLDGTNDDPNGITPDTCGDIDQTHNPLSPAIVVTATCIDTDGDGKLNLPYCTSWRQPGANDLCTSPLDAFPGSPSKCKCDIGFNVDIHVPPAELDVVKTANPTQVDEPGAEVTFEITVTNVSSFASVTLNTLTDNIYNDITTSSHDGIVSTTCSVPYVLQPNDDQPNGPDTYSCSFVATVSANAGNPETDTVTVMGNDENGNDIIGSASATVDVVDVLPALSLVKTANPTEVLDPGDLVTFTVVLTNNSVDSDPVTIASLVDDIHGDLNGQGDCAVPQMIPSGDSYTCSFTAFVPNNPDGSEVDTVTATGTDDEGNGVIASDVATVNINDLPSAIEVSKTASPTSVDEPGNDVTFNFTVNNLSDVDTVVIDTLTDNVFGDLNGQGDCSVPQTIPPQGSYVCSATFFVRGVGGDVHTNEVTVSGLDDDGRAVRDTDNALVNINSVPITECEDTPTTCDDGDACTADSCDPATGCVHDRVICDDGNACTADSCDPATGCTAEPISCDDGNACTADSCDPATGCAAEPISCDDGNACTADSCDPVAGCVHDPIPSCVDLEDPPLVCDINGDKQVDINDINLINDARGEEASGSDDPRDVNGDGYITINDSRACVLQCTNPRCAP